MLKMIYMKNSAIKWVVFTTIFLLIFTVLSHTDVSLGIIYALFITGNMLVIGMVYAVLTDNYKTDLTFKDWYQDRPRKTEG